MSYGCPEHRLVSLRISQLARLVLNHQGLASQKLSIHTILLAMRNQRQAAVVLVRALIFRATNL